MPSNNTSLQYRPEIDGLRAVAVLAVIAFHAGVSGLSGGFVGVDVFYVISGFLITKIVNQGLSEGRFSFASFYARRIKRLLPAASALLVAAVAGGALILTPFEFRELAKSAMFSAVFLANWWFMQNSGYFDQASDLSPLVHMWSLAVEEQFYLVFPALIFLAHRLGGLLGVRAVIGAVTVASLTMSVTLSAYYPDFSFYMLPTRAWELGIGGLLSLIRPADPGRERTNGVIAGMGVLLIGGGILGISHDDVYPGYLALVPVTGTALTIYGAAGASNPIRRLLAAAPMVFVGRFSYSAYLWHWPLVVYYRIYSGKQSFDALEVAALFAGSLALGYVSWRFIEERFRHAKVSLARVYAGFIVATGIVTALPLFVYLERGFPARIPEELRPIADTRVMWRFDCVEEIRPFPEVDESFCVIGHPWQEAEHRGVVWGDSHSQHWAPMLHREAKRRGLSLVIAPRQCPPYLSEELVRSHYISRPRFTEDCTLRNSVTVDWINADPSIRLIVMAAAWSGHVRMLWVEGQEANRSSLPAKERSSTIGASLSRAAFSRTLDHLDLEGRKVLLVGDVARPNRNLTECAIIAEVKLLRRPCTETHRELDAARVRTWHRDSDRVLAEVAEAYAEVDAIFPIPAQCGESTCPTYLNGELLYRDSNHFRRNLKPETVADLSQRFGLSDYFDSLDFD